MEVLGLLGLSVSFVKSRPIYQRISLRRQPFKDSKFITKLLSLHDHTFFYKAAIWIQRKQV